MTLSEQIESIRREAKRISRATTITHSQALDVLAVQKGFSHWGALRREIESAPSPLQPSDGAILSPGMLVDRLLGGSVRASAACGDARHLLISGAAATGKTTVLNLMLRELPKGATIWLSGTRGDVDGCPMANEPPMAVGPDNGMTEERHAAVARAAIAARADVLVFDEISTANARVVLDVARRGDAPMMLAIIHAGDPENVLPVMRDRTDGRDGILSSDRFAVMHMERDPFTGRRIVSDVRRI